MDDPVIKCMRYVIGKTCKTSAILIVFLGLRLLDLLGLIFNIIAACTIVRLPGLWMALFRYHGGCGSFSERWKWIGILQILIFISDIPIMLMIPFLIIFPWRIYLVIKGTDDWSYDKFGYEGCSIRNRIVKHFVLLVFDVLSIPFVILIGLSWRCPIFIRRFKKAKKEKKEIAVKYVVTLEFLFLIIDILCLPFFIIVIFSWRSPVIISKFMRVWKHNHDSYGNATGLDIDDEFYLRWKCILNFIQLIIDVLSIPVILFTIFSWRLIFFAKAFHKLAHKQVRDYDERPEVVVFKTTRQKLPKIYRKTRKEFWYQGLTLLVLDIPCIILAVIILILFPVFPWRTYQLFVGFYKECFKSAAAAITEEGAGVQEPLKELPRSQKCVRLLVVATFVSLIIDIPALIGGIIVMLTGWRFPFLIEQILKAKHYNKRHDLTVSERVTINLGLSVGVWLAVLQQICLLFVDIVSGIITVIIFMTLWRAYPLYKSIKKTIGARNIQPKDNDGENVTHVQVKITEEVELTRSGSPHSSSSLVEHNPFASPVPPKDEFKHSVWTYCLSSIKGWKIRKQIFINLAFLFIDLPALILLVINCIFVIRIPAILSSLVGSGNIFMEFSFIIYTETAKLIIDLVFMVLFVVLMFSRPVAIWVNTLEDTKHRKVREIKAYLIHINHVLKSKNKYLNKINSTLSILIKENEGANLDNLQQRSYQATGVQYTNTDSEFKSYVQVADEATINFVKLRLSQVTVEYTKLLKGIRDEIFKKELDDKVIYYLSKLIFLENKLPYHLSRKFFTEAMFVRNASAPTRRRNLELIEKEYFKYEHEKNDVYELFSEYKIDKVPLWEETCGLRTRTRKETQKVLIETLKNGNFVTFLLCILNTMLIYRAPSMYHQIFTAFHLRRSIAQSTLKEYFLDLVMFLKVFLVIICIYRTPDLFSELTVDFFHKRSLTAARATADRYPAAIFSDVGRVIKTLLSWRSIVYTFTSILMLLLLPLSVMVNTFKSTISSIIFAYIVAVFFYLLAIISPFVIIFHTTGLIMDKDSLSNQVISYVIGGYWIIMIVLLLVYVTIKTKSSKTSDKHIKEIDYVRVNWFNIHVCLMQFIELIQILALVFSVQLNVFPESNTINTIAKYILLDVYSYEVKFIISVTLFIIWFFVCSIPLVLEGVLEYVPVNTFSKKHFTWRAYLSFFGSTLFMVIPEINMSFLSCDYNNCTNVSVCPSLYDSPNIRCWEGSHLGYASSSFIMMVWYVLTAMMCCMNFTDIGNKMIDLQFSPSYSALVNIIKMAMIFSVTLFREDTLWVLGLLFILTIITIIASFTFRLVTGMAVANSNVLFAWRIESLIIVLIACGTLLISESLSLKESYILYSPGILILVTVVSCLVFSKRLQFTSAQEAAKKRFKSTMKELVKNIESNNGFISDWKKIKHPLNQMLSVVRVANPQDKEAKEPDEEKWLITAQTDGPPPVSYEAAMAADDTSALPPPPEYDSAVTATPASVDDITDDYFVPSASNYVLGDVGEWTKFDAETYCLELGYMTALDNTTKQIELTDVHCTGADLLLLIEQNIRYDALSLIFVQNISTWKSSVEQANWVGLEKYASFLLGNATFDFTTPPSSISVSKIINEDLLKPSEDHTDFPEYVPLGDISDIKHKIHKRELAKVMEMLPQPWRDVFEKLIPTDLPIVYRVKQIGTDDVFELFEKVGITIKEVGPTGFKIAKGAKVTLPKTIIVKKVTEEELTFGPPYPSGSKGPITKELKSMNAKVVNGVPYIVVDDNRAKVSKVLDTLAGLSFSIK